MFMNRHLTYFTWTDHVTEYC